MKYFFPANGDISGCHNLCRGKYTVEDYGNKSKSQGALNFDDDVMAETFIHKAFEAVLQDYDYYGLTEVTPEQWALICEYVRENLGSNALEAILEIEDWTQEVFKTEGLFTISGI